MDVSWSTEEVERQLEFRIFQLELGVVDEKTVKETINASRELIYLLTPAFFYVWDASPQTGVST